MISKLKSRSADQFDSQRKGFYAPAYSYVISTEVLLKRFRIRTLEAALGHKIIRNRCWPYSSFSSDAMGWSSLKLSYSAKIMGSFDLALNMERSEFHIPMNGNDWTFYPGDPLDFLKENQGKFTGCYE